MGRGGCPPATPPRPLLRDRLCSVRLGFRVGCAVDCDTHALDAGDDVVCQVPGWAARKVIVHVPADIAPP